MSSSKKQRNLTIFMGITRVKKRAYGTGTTPPPASSLL